MNVTRKAIFEQAALKLRSDFGELSTVPHNALKGHEAEKLVKTFLSSHLPKRFNVGSGFVIDRQDSISKQTDVVVYDAFNCPVYRASEEAAIFPSNNVAAVVEVKSRLTKQELEDAYNKIAAIKKLTKTPQLDLPFLLPGQTLSQTLGCLFAFDSAISLDTLAKHYHELLASKNELGTQIDLIVVLDKGVVSFYGKPKGHDWGHLFIEGTGGPITEGMHLALAEQELGIMSLDAFLRYLLAHLIYFRGIVDHPGLDWSKDLPNGLTKLRYIASVTHVVDPQERLKKLEMYKQEVRSDFANSISQLDE